MKFRKEIVKIIRCWPLVTLERKQPLQAGGALLNHPTVRAIGQMPVYLGGHLRREPPLGEIIEQLLCLLAIHNVYKYSLSNPCICWRA